ncbi:hypothetical protein AFK68_26975 [Hydrocoleum sp. CS-953]|uniref:hypothetical protein n=1 Tax=Hydrocoleum sp. CS-953 TaxID=1671698 RepID=UPI000B9A7DAA|nr:hypothetical protein [Hydrocoleum sp. CS-953]OZH52033.1 hypothetical protein AFK68_26975 [Hydrocoleum sp. CS-953]
MIISELNYLESAEAEVLGGRGDSTVNNYDLTVYVDKNIYETVTKRLTTNLNIQGFVAQSIATADTFGGSAGFSSTLTNAQVDAETKSTFALSESIASISY